MIRPKVKRVARKDKPRLKPSDALILATIDSYVRKYDVRGASLAGTASDVLDGAVDRDDIDHLVNSRLLKIVRLEGNLQNRIYGVCGRNWTVMLTPRAQKLFWDDRLPKAA